MGWPCAYDESHLHIMLRVCSHCSQHYLWVFTEQIDWEAGDDPQHWAVLPLTEAEVKSRSYPLNYYPTERLHPERRSLQADFPSGEGQRIFWSTGLYIERHD